MTSVEPARLAQLQLLLTERCNLRCAHCAVPEETSPALSELTGEDWARFLTVAIGAGIRTVVLSGGEALLRPDCIGIAEHALCAGAESVVIVTNGTALPSTTSERLANLQRHWPSLRVHVSLDGAGPESHDAIRGAGTFNRTMAGLSRLRAFGGRIDGMHTVLHRLNQHELAALVALARSIGAQTWTVFPLAALGRGLDLDQLRLDDTAWREVLAWFAESGPRDLDVGLMGPTLVDEWTDLSEIPLPRMMYSPQACVGPDGACFTCPPLRASAVGAVSDITDGTPWETFDARLRQQLEHACPSCKYRPLCTGVDPTRTLFTQGVPIGEPSLPVPVLVRPGHSGGRSG